MIDMKFKVGDRVKIKYTVRMASFWYGFKDLIGREATVTKIYDEGDIILDNNAYCINFEEDCLVLIKNSKSKGVIQTMKSLLERMLEPETALLRKYVFDGDNLDFDNTLVQEAVLTFPGFKEHLVKIVKKQEKADKKDK